MNEITGRLEQLLKKGIDYFTKSSEAEMSWKPSPEKWSKKEILGHLIDSGINNLQRFTEIQFEEKPYEIRNYKQDELVKANNYQQAESKEIIDFWSSINTRILRVIEKQTEIELNYKIDLGKNDISDFRFLITDYVDHLEYHLNQIVGEATGSKNNYTA